MNLKKIIIIIVMFILAILVCLISFGDSLKAEFATNSAIKKLNNAMEMSLNLKSASMETNILKGSYYPDENPPQKILTDFEVKKPNKDKNSRNINFDVIFYYADQQKEVSNITNYEGIYLNVYYPYSKYNEIDKEKVKSIKVNKVENGTEYIVHYNGSHLSRRLEWEYCKVESDYEYFLINKDGVILDYISETHYKQQDKDTSEWTDGESYLNVKLKDYTLIK